MCHGPKLEDKTIGASIGVCMEDEDFDISTPVKNAPTGIESPPEPV
jgi:hypothetical protein